MKRVACWVGGIVAVAALSATAVADGELDKAINELEQEFAKVRSYSATSESMTDVQFGPGHTQKSEMSGTTEWMRKGDLALMRSEVNCKTTVTQGGNTTTTPSTITTVNDGEFLYVLTEENGQKTVMKSKAPAASTHHPKGYFVPYKAYYDIKLLPDQKIEGEDCYVFEMVMKPMEGVEPSGRQMIFFAKSHGLFIKSEAFDADEKLISWSISTGIKINADVEEYRFKFEIPEGAQVVDMTTMQQQPAQQQQAQPASEGDQATEPADEPKEEKNKKKKKKKKGLGLPKLPKLP